MKSVLIYLYSFATKNKKLDLDFDFNKHLLQYKEFKQIYRQTGVKPVQCLLVIFFTVGILMIGYIEHLLTCLVAILYPLYFSIKALRDKSKNNIKYWLQYWIVFAVFLNLESMFSYFLQAIPMYFFYKVVFLLVLFLPEYNGAEYFYHNLLQPLFERYHNHIYEYSVHLFKNVKKVVLEEEGEEEIVDREQ